MLKKKSFCCIIGLMFFLMNSIYAEDKKGVIKGSLIEAETEKPLTEFSIIVTREFEEEITIPDTDRKIERREEKKFAHVKSDNDGNFLINDVTPGRYYSIFLPLTPNLKKSAQIHQENFQFSYTNENLSIINVSQTENFLGLQALLKLIELS